MTTRTFYAFQKYLTTTTNATLKIGAYPAMPITFSMVRVSWGLEPIVSTQGKTFQAAEHMFYHYNKYHAGRNLDARVYLEDGCAGLLPFIVIQDGFFNQLRATQVLELTPAEWAELPALEEAPAETASVPTAVSTAAYRKATSLGISIAAATSLETLAAVERRLDATLNRCETLHRGCDVLEHAIETVRAYIKPCAI